MYVDLEDCHNEDARSLNEFSRRDRPRVASAATIINNNSISNNHNAGMPRADSVGSLDFKPGTSVSPMSTSRPSSSTRSAGPSPLTISAVPSSVGSGDTIPLAVAFQEVVHADDEAVRKFGDCLQWTLYGYV